MNDARIAELLEPFLGDDGRSTAALSLAQVRLISMYVDLLLRWNDRVNLTAIRKPGRLSRAILANPSLPPDGCFPSRKLRRARRRK